ncbi:MAG: peptidylprolyl isomerase [Patescibacteria group bacterium]
MSRRQKLRKLQKLQDRQAAIKELRARRNLYRVAFPWKKLIWPVVAVILVVVLVLLTPKTIMWVRSMSKITGPFGEITREDLNKSNFATLVTTEGDIKIDLFNQIAPNTVANFVVLANQDFYDGVLFHRVIDDFMIQTGDPLSKDDDPANDGTGGPGYTFADEITTESAKLVRGVVAMANSGPDTNGSQFFIITKESTPWLDGLHTPFGSIVYGMDVIDKVSKTKTDTTNDRPIGDIIIKDIIISES